MKKIIWFQFNCEFLRQFIPVCVSVYPPVEDLHVYFSNPLKPVNKWFWKTQVYIMPEQWKWSNQLVTCFVRWLTPVNFMKILKIYFFLLKFLSSIFFHELLSPVDIGQEKHKQFFLQVAFNRFNTSNAGPFLFTTSATRGVKWPLSHLNERLCICT